MFYLQSYIQSVIPFRRRISCVLPCKILSIPDLFCLPQGENTVLIITAREKYFCNKNNHRGSRAFSLCRVAEYLVNEVGANVNAVNHRGDTALNLAAYWGKVGPAMLTKTFVYLGF